MQIDSLMQSEYLWAWALAGVAVLVLAGVLIWRWRHHRREGHSWGKEESDALEALRASHPEFFRIMTDIRQRRRPGQVFRHDEAQAAFDKILAHQARRASSGKKGGSLLDLAPAEADHGRRTLDAAVLTILRTLYLDPELKKALTPEAEQELDHYLDALAAR